MSEFSDFFGGSSGLGIRPMKAKSYTNWTGGHLAASSLPVARASQNRHFSLPTTLAGSLLLLDSSTGSTIATVAPSNIIDGTSQEWLDFFYYNSTDQALWVAAKNAANEVRIAKIEDASPGNVVHPGAKFTPATIANWTNKPGFVEPSGSNLKFWNGEFWHTVAKATGQIVSQDQAATIAGVARGIGGLTFTTGYVSADGNCAFAFASIVEGDGDRMGTTILQFQLGLVDASSITVESSSMFGFISAASVDAMGRPVMIDTDTVVFTPYVGATSTGALPWRIFPRTELDRFALPWRIFPRTELDRFLSALKKKVGG